MVIKNPLPEAIHQELSEQVRLVYEDHKRRHDRFNSLSPSLPRVLPDWEHFVSRERLMESMARPKLINTAHDRNRRHLPINQELRADATEAAFRLLGEHYDSKIRIRNQGTIYYPTYYMGWHTNNKTPGTRIYAIWSTGDKTSFFRYYDKDKDEVITCYDDKGLTIRQFDVSVEKPLWHCVGCKSNNRFSLGFMLNETSNNPQ